MLRGFSSISIQQVPTRLWESRGDLIPLDFVTSYEITSGWENHTDTAKIEFPKNIVLNRKVGDDEFLFRQNGSYNVILGGSSVGIQTINEPQLAPLLMRGDVVTIQDGYLYKDEFGDNQTFGATHFFGYVSKTYSEIPISIELEDNFYLLKRTPLDVTNWKGSLVDLCKYIINLVNKNFGLNTSYNSLKNGNPYPILSLTDTIDSITLDFSLGYLDIGTATCAQVLDKIRSNYNLESFFIGNQLHFGYTVYDESIAKNEAIFEFRNNILDDSSLEYSNKDDLQLSAVITSRVITSTNKKTVSGLNKTKIEKLSILIYWDVRDQIFKFLEKKKGEKFPENETGERREFIYPVAPSDSIPTNKQLFDFGVKLLEKYYYTGFKGTFTTFGYPFVNWNDNVLILDNILSDRNGWYKVKKVTRKGGINGITQEIELEYKLNIQVDNKFLEVPYNGGYIYMI